MRLKLITNDNERDFDELLPDVFTGRKELLGVACIEETEDEDRILGASVVVPREDEDTLELQWMYVKPEFRRMGAGSCMLRGIRDMAEAAGLGLIDVCFWGEDTEAEEDLWTLDPSMEEDDRLEDDENRSEDAENNRDNSPSGTWILKQLFLQCE